MEDLHCGSMFHLPSASSVRSWLEKWKDDPAEEAIIITTTTTKLPPAVSLSLSLSRARANLFRIRERLPLPPFLALSRWHLAKKKKKKRKGARTTNPTTTQSLGKDVDGFDPQGIRSLHDLAVIPPLPPFLFVYLHSLNGRMRKCQRQPSSPTWLLARPVDPLGWVADEGSS
ncbi:hypothetical protein IE53DRAFT_388368 [Violaceomyces palustris]|uniref:Uncharacterized protein n=1 Tax=Violaceomyces palustris TaxID=1673888 RepID=A0ACD0NUE0_9BASI|nr:hypothetical protein IE53DRAFT_388368 [Violaceomyces palustris]